MAGFDAILRRRYAAAAVGATPLAAELRNLLADWPADQEPMPGAPVSLPACSHLAAALAAGRAGPEAALAQAIAALAPALAWTYGYPARAGQPGLSAAIAFTQIVGPAGLLRSERLRVGLTLIAPGTDYPAHAHPAVETYLVVSGAALWRLGEQPSRVEPPGSLIFHPGGMAHAMRTWGEPLLAVYSWSGDVLSPSVYVDRQRAAAAPQERASRARGA
ncbi:MAG: dimethylsulfonioproprionate lyase family protein [Dongiaceae bacterium]